MFRLIYYAALILGLYFLFRFILKIILFLFVNNVRKKMFVERDFSENESVENNENTVTYKQKRVQRDEDIIEFEEE